MLYDIEIIYRDGRSEKTIIDNCEIIQGCLHTYTRFGVAGGKDRYIPLDQIAEWKVK